MIVVVSTIIWIPFLKVLDKQYLNEEKAQAAKEAEASATEQ